MGPDGALWFTEQTGDKVGRITTAGEITEHVLPDGALPGPIVAAGGAIWFGQRNAGVLTRMSTTGAITGAFPLPHEHADPLGLVAAPDGGLWIADHAASSLARATLDGVLTREVRVRSAPDALAIGPDGDLWYVSGDEGRIGRIDLRG